MAENDNSFLIPVFPERPSKVIYIASNDKREWRRVSLIDDLYKFAFNRVLSVFASEAKLSGVFVPNWIASSLALLAKTNSKPFDREMVLPGCGYNCPANAYRRR